MANKGFTLIEVIIYLGLFALVIGGAMAAVFQIVDSTNKTNDKVVVQEDADFILRKIDWAFNGATTATVNSTSLTVNGKIFALSGTNLTLDGNPLNSSFTQISDVSGKIFSLTGKQVDITLKVNNQEFDETKYLR